MKTRAWGSGFAGLLLLACGGSAREGAPTGQILLYVTTDAPLPVPPGEITDPGAAPALFDRLRIDLFEPGAGEPCADCSRDFELDRVRVRNGDASIGVVPPPGVTGYVARARLFRFVTLEGGEPQALSTIDTYAALPAVQKSGIVEATIALRVDDVGKTLGSLSAPNAVTLGKADFSRIGEWPEAQRTPCTGSAPSGEACVPGGAYWMGNPHSGLHEPGTDSNIPRLVVLSPFFVDTHEVTVAEYRASNLAISTDERQDPLVAADDPFDPEYFCTYSSEPLTEGASRETLPVNCISWSAASAYCGAQGKRLPSEAEYEYLASGLRSDLFVWGTKQATCAGTEWCESCNDTVWGRGGFDPGDLGANSLCRVGDDLGGVLPPGSGALDRLNLGDVQVVDLMGNLAEWTRDTWNRISEPCWAEHALLENPSCSSPSTLDLADEGQVLHTLKGQSWNGVPFPAAQRRPAQNPSPERGFRCVRGN